VLFFGLFFSPALCFLCVEIDFPRSGKGKKAGPPAGEGVKLIYGTMTLAASVDDAQAIEQLASFFARRTELGDSKVELDTASLYEDGKTELLLGRVLTEDQKSKMYIATKGTPPSFPLSITPDSLPTFTMLSIRS
jgi:aryl-alcohol dehydrogenase-like predicted oxidoreductase